MSIERSNGDWGAENIYSMHNQTKTIRDLANEAIAKGHPCHISWFAKKNPNLPDDIINDLAQATINMGYPDFIIGFAKDIPRAPINDLAQAIINLKNNEYKALYIYRFAKEVVGAPIEDLEQAIIKTNDPLYICSFAKEITFCNYSNLADAIIKISKPGYILYFAEEWNNPTKWIGGPVVAEKLARAFINLTDNPAHLYLYAFNTIKPPIDILADAIIQTNNAKYIGYFLTTVPDIPEHTKSRLAATLEIIGDYSWLKDFDAKKTRFKIREQIVSNEYSNDNSALSNTQSLTDEDGQKHMS